VVSIHAGHAALSHIGQGTETIVAAGKALEITHDLRKAQNEQVLRHFERRAHRGTDRPTGRRRRFDQSPWEGASAIGILNGLRARWLDWQHATKKEVA
jgi:hypothetical protein